MTMKIKTWTEGVEFADDARAQVERTASMPFVWPHVAVMPDVHLGIGSTVGTVVPTKAALIPACVGVDIGCGMNARLTTLTANQLPDTLSEWRSRIESVVPVGKSSHATDLGYFLPADLDEKWIEGSFDGDKARRQLGTLGSGNHFIELCLDELDRVWVVIHSGSRGIGNAIGRKYIELAKREMERWFIHLPDSDLAYLPEGSEHFNDYFAAMEWAQRYASMNRYFMMKHVCAELKLFGKPFGKTVPEYIPSGSSTPYVSHCDLITCHHNYVSKEKHFGADLYVTRKGAVSAKEGEYGIIPGSMGAKSYIVRGKGNRDSLCSCSHGAGRRKSRRQARDSMSQEAFATEVAGVECRLDQDVWDEAPSAYKDIDHVMIAQSDLVDVVHTLKQVLCVKG